MGPGDEHNEDTIIVCSDINVYFQYSYNESHA
jgi:hypothetical protein